MLVDNAAMQLVKNPAQFDVVVTTNMFGDILSDESSQITARSACFRPRRWLVKKRNVRAYSRSAPDIAGQNKANPIATILSAAMMLRYSFDLDKEADAIESAVDDFLEKGFRTADLVGNTGIKPLSTTEVTDKILELL